MGESITAPGLYSLERLHVAKPWTLPCSPEQRNSRRARKFAGDLPWLTKIPKTDPRRKPRAKEESGNDVLGFALLLNVDAFLGLRGRSTLRLLPQKKKYPKRICDRLKRRPRSQRL